MAFRKLKDKVRQKSVLPLPQEDDIVPWSSLHTKVIPSTLGENHPDQGAESSPPKTYIYDLNVSASIRIMTTKEELTGRDTGLIFMGFKNLYLGSRFHYPMVCAGIALCLTTLHGRDRVYESQYDKTVRFLYCKEPPPEISLDLTYAQEFPLKYDGDRHRVIVNIDFEPSPVPGHIWSSLFSKDAFEYFKLLSPCVICEDNNQFLTY